ncbi:MAG: HEAT repeat domain-containing protein [Planctomycetota bacterium]
MSCFLNTARRRLITWPAVSSMFLAVFISLGAVGCGGRFDAETSESNGKPENPVDSGVAAAHSSDEFRTADYCTVLLAPKLRVELGMNVAQRVEMAVLEDRLMPGLKGRLSMPRGTGGSMLSGGGDSEEILLRCLDHDGQEVRDALTPQQTNHFGQLRATGKVQAIRCRVSSPASHFEPTYFEILYTAFGEKGPLKRPIKETVRREGGKTVTETNIQIEESHGDGKALAQINNISDAIEVLGAKNHKIRNYGALWLLKIAKVNDEDRDCVVAALKPLIDDFEQGHPQNMMERMKEYTYYDRTGHSCSVGAFCRWAGREQLPEIARLGHLSTKQNTGCVAVALKTLLRLDPSAAEKLVRERLDDFFFRTYAIRTLESLSEADTVPQDEAKKLLEILKNHRPSVAGRNLDRTPRSPPRDRPSSRLSNPVVPSGIAGLDEAISGLSGDFGKQMAATQWLTTAELTETADREKALAALKSVLNSNNLTLKLQVLKAFCRFATKDDVPLLVKAAEADRSQQACWSMVIGALARLDAGACRQLFERRYDDFFFRTEAVRTLSTLGSDYEDAVLPLLTSKNPRVRREACAILGKIGTSKSAVAIEKCLSGTQDRQEKIRLKRPAEQAIAEIRQREANK